MKNFEAAQWAYDNAAEDEWVPLSKRNRLFNYEDCDVEDEPRAMPEPCEPVDDSEGTGRFERLHYALRCRASQHGYY